MYLSNKEALEKCDNILKKMLQTPPTLNKPLKAKEQNK